MNAEKPDLEDAYALQGAEDAKAVYAAWADSYDAGCVSERRYQLHERVAAAFVAEGGIGPVLDLGAGTGILGMALAARNCGPLEAADISPEMLDQARTKGVYRRLVVTDANAHLPFPDNSFAGVVSSGTFTLGHLGPEILPDLLRVLRPGGLLTISVNSRHYDEAGFADALRVLFDRIAKLRSNTVPIYAATDSSDPHSADTAKIICLTKATP